MSVVLVWLWLVLPAIAFGFQMPDELYFRAPPMFHLDDYERCLYQGNVYCLGEFQLRPQDNTTLYQDLMEYSSYRYFTNRSRLYRGVCVTSDIEDDEPSVLFQQAVDQDMADNYGLRARLKRLHYCKSKASPGTRPLDYTDVFMAVVIAVVIALNVVGTVYDFRRNPEEKPNRFLMAWSLRSNWNRLTAIHGGDERLDALTFIHGIKAHQSTLVVCAHTMLAMFTVYVRDSRALDEIITNPAAPIAKNGTIVVQTFATLTSFLLAYMLLLHVEKTKKLLSVSKAPAIILNRYMRLVPTVMFVTGVTATWVARAGDGPMWSFVQQLEADCRAKWWTHLFFINNLVNPDQRCTIQTWFLAVDMQVFVVAVVLTLLLLPHPRRALRILLALYAAVVATILALNIQWNIVPMSHMSTIDNIRELYVGLESYNWGFSMPWTTIPASLHGLILAFLHYNLQQDGFKPEENKWLRVATLCTYPALLATVFSSEAHQHVSSPLAAAIIATVDRILFNGLVTFLLWALINNPGGMVNKYLTWSGFHILSRIALSTALVHWHFNLVGLAAHMQPIELSLYNCTVQFFAGMTMTCMLAVPLHLMVELPSQKLVDMLM